jgi:hypothetical protein
LTKSAQAQLLTFAATMALTAAAAWHFARADMRRTEVDSALRPVSALLDDNARLLEWLRRSEGVDADSAILNGYLALVRKDGVPKHSDLKQAIDRLVTNDTTIVALLQHYTAGGASAQFRLAANQYTEYAVGIRDRWQAVFEVFMAGGNLPAVSNPPPADFKAALHAEMLAR